MASRSIQACNLGLPQFLVRVPLRSLGGDCHCSSGSGDIVSAIEATESIGDRERANKSFFVFGGVADKDVPSMRVVGARHRCGQNSLASRNAVNVSGAKLAIEGPAINNMMLKLHRNLLARKNLGMVGRNRQGWALDSGRLVAKPQCGQLTVTGSTCETA